MLTTSPILTSDAKNASPRAFQFASSRSPLHGSPGLQRSRSRKNSLASQSPTVAPSPTPGRATSGPMASPSKLRAQNSAQENSTDLANGSAHADPAKKIVVPVEPSGDSANPQAAPEQPRRTESSQNKPNSAKRSANSHAISPPSAEAQDEVADHAALENPDRPAQRPKTLPAAPKALPLAYETGTTEDMVVLIAHMISELIETNDGLALSSGNLTRFHSRYVMVQSSPSHTVTCC